MAAFYGICEEHPTLHVLPRIGAGRGLRSVSMGENVIKAICGTNVTWSQAVKMINRLGQLGPVVPHFVNLNAWPTAREILRAGESYLSGVCRVGYRAESILAFCSDVDKGDVDPDSWAKLATSDEVSSDELVSLMRKVRGIGPASANYLLSFLGRHDKISIDSATVAHVAQTHMDGQKPTHKQIEKIYEPYGRWKHLVWWYEHWLTWETAKQIVRDANL
jgi:3-methyladenine DNA glycosylase/8-oxoguanine DNA glycosylase